MASIPWLVKPSASELKQSVVFIDTKMEVEFNPFEFLFFGSLTAPAIKPPEAAPPLRKEIVHGYGTGFFVNGSLITARHVVVPEGAGKVLSITVTTAGGKSWEVTMLRDDQKLDLAELKTKYLLPSFRLASRAPRVDDAITEIGNPALIRFVVSKGTIVGFDREQGYNIAALDTFGGNSGGPDLNARGEVVGLTHTIISGTRFTGIGTLAQLRDFLFPDETR